jgi:hypothetical protein
VLGAAYGACMGVFALLREGRDGGLQMLASTLKVPLLFLLTLAVTFPSLYVFSALAGSRLGALGTLRVVLVAILVDVAALAGLGPVTAFFASCTTSYAFIKLWNVLVFTVAGVLSLGFLHRTLGRLLEPADHGSRNPAKGIVVVWSVVYGIVGAQMGWVLRPFIGYPHIGFEWFRQRESNVFENVLETIRALLS